MSSLEELRSNYRLMMSGLIEKYNTVGHGTAESVNLLSEIERLDVLIKDVERLIDQRDSTLRKEILEESLKEIRKKEMDEAKQREVEEKEKDRKNNVIIASITGGCSLLGSLFKLNRQDRLINTVLDFSTNADVTGCSKQSLFRSLLGDFFKM